MALIAILNYSMRICIAKDAKKDAENAESEYVLSALCESLARFAILNCSMRICIAKDAKKDAENAKSDTELSTVC